MNHKYRINSDWKRLADQIVMPNQRVLVLGASDAGKSTFCRFLIDYACAASLKVALIDADVGQSQIGPPTTIGMKQFESIKIDDNVHLPFGGYANPKDIPHQKVNANAASSVVISSEPSEVRTHKADALYFVGSTSPQRNLLPMLTGTRLMVDAALNAGVDFIVIDTTGYVQDGAAAMLKQQKIDLIRPDHLVCIRRSKDLERIVSYYRNMDWLTIHYLQPHKSVRTKSSEARKRNRETNFKTYFAESQPQKIPFEQVRGARTPFFNGRIANQKELDVLSGVTEIDIDYAEWGHRSLYLIARRKLTRDATKNLKNYLSLSFILYETPAYFEQRLVGMINKDGNTFAVGIIENADFKNRELQVRCESGIALDMRVLQFGDYQFVEKLW